MNASAKKKSTTVSLTPDELRIICLALGERENRFWGIQEAADAKVNSDPSVQNLVRYAGVVAEREATYELRHKVRDLITVGHQ